MQLGGDMRYYTKHLFRDVWGIVVESGELIWKNSSVGVFQRLR